MPQRGHVGAALATRLVARGVPVLALLCAVEVAAGQARPRGTLDVVSLREMRQANVILQKWDLSCGSAALSTLLTFDVGDPVSEEEVVKGILQRADPVRIRARQGFSLLDLKRFVVARGHQAEGYGKLDMNSLAKLMPAIVPTRIGGFDHFVIVRGIRDGRVLLADPAYGNRTMPVERFEALWPRRIAFVVEPRGGRPPGPPDVGPAPLVPAPVVRELISGARR